MQPLGTQEKIDILVSGDRLKVWSLIITILGDLCVTEHDVVSGKTLRFLTGRMGVSNQAVRVALHRLHRNGWVTSVKDGRESNYSLSDMGWSETQAVRARIYSKKTPKKATARLLVAPSPTNEWSEMLPDDAVIIAPRTALVCIPPDDLPQEVLCTKLEPEHLPDWVAKLLASSALRKDYLTLIESVSKIISCDDPVDLLDATVLRLLVLHHWRRLRLRHGELPDALLTESWEGERARGAVMSALSKFKRPEIRELTKLRVNASRKSTSHRKSNQTP